MEGTLWQVGGSEQIFFTLSVGSAALSGSERSRLTQRVLWMLWVWGMDAVGATCCGLQGCALLVLCFCGGVCSSWMVEGNCGKIS